MFGVDTALYLAAAAAVAGGAANYFGAQSVNSANQRMSAGQMAYQWGVDQWQAAKNVDMMREANANSAYQAALARDWTKELSNTSYQRGMADMKAAGLNPILAYAQGGATAPAASAASTAQASVSPHGAPGYTPAVNALGPAVSSATQTASALMGLRQAASQIQQTEANTALAAANTQVAETEAALNSARTAETAKRTGLVQAEHATELLNPALRRAQTAMSGASAQATQQEITQRDRWGFGQTGREASSAGPIARNFAGAVAETTRRPAQAAGEAVGTALGRANQGVREATPPHQGTSWEDYQRSGRTLGDILRPFFNAIR